MVNCGFIFENKEFKKYMLPGRSLTCDESMIPFKGRLKFKQFITLKRTRCGIKQFILCDRSGYVTETNIGREKWRYKQKK